MKFKFRVPVACRLALFAGLAGAAPAQNNYVQNPGFESATDGNPNDSFPNWSFVSNDTSGIINQRDASLPYENSYSSKIQVDVALAMRFGELSQIILTNDVLAAGATLRYIVAAKGNDGSIPNVTWLSTLTINGPTTPVVITNFVKTSVGGGWATHTNDFLVPDGATGFVLKFRNEVAGTALTGLGATLWMDGVSLQVIPEPSCAAWAASATAGFFLLQRRKRRAVR